MPLVFNKPVKPTKRQILKAIDWAKRNRDGYSVSKMQKDCKFSIDLAWAIDEILVQRGKVTPLFIHWKRQVFM